MKFPYDSFGSSTYFNSVLLNSKWFEYSKATSFFRSQFIYKHISWFLLFIDFYPNCTMITQLTLYKFIPLKNVRPILWFIIWSLFVNVYICLKKKWHILLLLGPVLYVFPLHQLTDQIFCNFYKMIKSYCHCLLVLSDTKKSICKYHTIIMQLSISHCNYVSICFVIFVAPYV